eukprot:TRINITY_DN46690_c0_g1_i1.p1 TRINITY_DN46690_c0_g1~~TRINITY_DN46690_c0_g1_i1.p1  ORF type:complete len:337 (+),score=60.11 TRINITY_DN46690_c0_g1_i1:64-1011(+)
MRAAGRIELNISIPEPDAEMQAYPAEALQVRNTFIHIASPAVSLNRASLTCPSSYVGRLQNAFQQDDSEQGEAEPSERPLLCLASILDEQMPSTPEPLTRAYLLPSSCCWTPPKQIPPTQQALECVMSHDGYGTPPSQIPPMQAHEGVMSHEGGGMAASSVFSIPQHLALDAGLVSRRYYHHESMYLQVPQHDVHMAAYSQAIVAPTRVPLHDAPATLAAPPLAPPSHMPPYEEMPMHPPLAISMSLPTEPAPGSAELPSIGSKNHYTGECKPCAFLHSKGCENGAVCKFCHLCDAGEKKRRQKEKKNLFKLGGA